MNPPVKIMEQLTRVAPLGVLFADAVTGAVVGAGLRVSAYPSGTLPVPPGGAAAESGAAPFARRAYAVHNASGVWVLDKLPGLRAAENGAGDRAFWDAPPVKKLFTVEVEDLEGRYLPFRFERQLPSEGLYRGADILPALSPPERLRGVPLYPAPAYRVPGGLTALRAQLYEIVDAADRGKDRPAAWALVEARHAGQLLARGYADREGRATLVLPYPPMQDTSPTDGRGLREQEWLLDVRVAYGPAPAAPPRLPALADVLAQPTVTAWENFDLNQTLTQATLRFGEEVVLKSKEGNAPQPRQRSELFIT